MVVIDIDEFSYNKKEIILKDIHFDIKPGEILGLIGANGAGKSTTIKTILGLNEYKMGHKNAVCFDKDISLGYIPERPIIYEEMTLWEHIELCAVSYHLKEWKKEAKGLLEDFHLDTKVEGFPKDFSKGMQQKLMFILAYLPRPDFYIVDEPIMGLDPLSIKMILKLLQSEKKRGAGILMCTHALDTAEKYCDRFIILANKTLIYNGNLQNLKDITDNKNGDLLDCFTTLIKTNRDTNYVEY